MFNKFNDVLIIIIIQTMFLNFLLQVLVEAKLHRYVIQTSPFLIIFRQLHRFLITSGVLFTMVLERELRSSGKFCWKSQSSTIKVIKNR